MGDKMDAHYCFEGERVYYKNFETTSVYLGHNWAFTKERCVHCGKIYLRAFLESDGYSHSGRWVMGEIEPDWTVETPDEIELLKFLYELPRLYAGGSFWKSTGFWAEKSERNPVYSDLNIGIKGVLD